MTNPTLLGLKLILAGSAGMETAVDFGADDSYLANHNPCFGYATPCDSQIAAMRPS